ncbi:MAG: efflux transporter outer membrane subunit [Chitinophagaceae bacterium]
MASIKGISAAFVFLTLLGSCDVLHHYKRPADLQAEHLFRGHNDQDSSGIAEMPWRELFTDSRLRQLIEEGLQRNYDLKIAVARMESAAASVQQSTLALLPSLSANAQMTHSKPSTAQVRANGVNVSSIPSYNVYALTGTSSWELDIWGKLRSARRANLSAYLKSDAYRRAVQTQLIATIANDYFQLLAYDEQIRIVEASVQNRSKEVDVVRDLKDAAIVTGADVVNSEANVYAASLQLPDLKRSRREQENALSILLALPPDSIARGSFGEQAITADLRTGIPAKLLANRSDVQEAEYAFRNAFDLVNVARAYFYPALTISGTAGFATANTLQHFFDGTFYGSIIGGLTQPIFNQGQNKARLRIARATQQEAYYNFQLSLLTAGKEVSDALYAYDMAKEKQAQRGGQLAALDKASDFTKELLKYTSNTNYTDVLTAEQNLLTAKLSAVNDKLQELQSAVNLYKALGGGWRQ